MRTLARQWIKVLLLVMLTSLSCNSKMLAADNAHYGDAGKRKAESHCVKTTPKGDNSRIYPPHSALRFNAEVPVRTTLMAKPFSIQRVSFKIKNLFSLQRISFASYHGSDPKASHQITLMPQCDYFVFTLRHLLC